MANAWRGELRLAGVRHGALRHGLFSAASVSKNWVLVDANSVTRFGMLGHGKVGSGVPGSG